MFSFSRFGSGFVGLFLAKMILSSGFLNGFEVRVCSIFDLFDLALQCNMEQ